MDTKLLTGAGGFLLLAATILPSALGHDERPALAIPYGGDPDGVSGRFVGAAGPALAIEAYNQSHPAYRVFPFGSILCDAEVVVDGNLPVNEESVDGFGASAGNTGKVPDSFDDGGQGGACHRDRNHYSTPEFNTPGCQGGQTARASNGVTDVFIGAACDWKQIVSGTSTEEVLLLCIVNSVLALDPLVLLGPPTPDVASALAEVKPAIDCVEWYVFDCLLGMGACPPGAIESCGSDGIPDAFDFGYGSGSSNPAVFPAATGVWQGGSENAPCPAYLEEASIFVFDTVATNGGSLVDPDDAGPLDPVYVPGIVNVYPALTGELWTDL